MKMLLELKKRYKPSDIDELLSNEFKFVKNNKKLEYLNIPLAFDIETTSFYDASGEKASTMYAWVLAIYGKGIIGRTWDEFLLCLKRIKDFYQLEDNKRVIIWIHNLAFEFSFMQHLFNWINVFAVDDRKPVYAITDMGIEFRCSYILSGYSLDMLAKNLTTYKIEKLKGDLDYSLLRHTKTPLSDKETQYVLQDGLILNAFIMELLEQYIDFHKFPLTKTGFVRKYVRNECLYGGNKSHKKSGSGKAYMKYHSLMQTLQIPSLKAYEQMKRVYTGGFTHANALYTGVVVDDVTSFDFSSSYPSVMVNEMYPMSTPKLIQLKSIEEFNEYLKLYCCMFDIRFYNIKPKIFSDNPISISKCYCIKNAVENNGRLVEADEITISINEVDYEYIKDFYTWDYCDIWNFRIMEKSYLPTPFVKAILNLYSDKTTLKGSEDIDDIIRYMSSKQNLNGCYGMCVTDILQMNRKYVDGKWIDEIPDIKSVFDKYNDSKSRFLFYPWGIWVTSYARRNLLLSIQAMGDDYLYSDTDSIKIRNAKEHIGWINKYNEFVKIKLEKAMKYHKLDFELCEPKTRKGDKRLIGIYDFDGYYKKFKTLGAKRYLYQSEDDSFHLTCSGVTKQAIKYLEEKAKIDKISVFDEFTNNLYIPPDKTGKNIHTYIDYEMEGYLVDYLGNKNYYHELSGVHLEGAEYTLSLSKNYLDYLEGIRQLW